MGVGGPADWVGQEKRETALCRFPLPAGPPLLPREERLLFLLRLSLYSPSGASSSLALRFRRAWDLTLGLNGIRPLASPSTLFEFSTSVESYIYLRLHSIYVNRSVSRNLEHKVT